MSKAGIATLREALAAQANHWAIFPALLLFASTLRVSGFVIFAWVLLGFLPTCMFIARDFVQSFILQISLFPIFVGTLVLLPIEPVNLKAAMIFVGIIYVVLAVFKTIKNNPAATRVFPPFVPLGLNFILSIIAFYTIKTPITFTMHVSAILSTCLSMLAFYVDRFFIFTVSNEGTTSNMPRTKMFKSGLSSSVSYLGLIALIMVFIASFSISDDFFRAIMGFLRDKFRDFMAFLHKLFGDEEYVSNIRDGGETEPFKRPIIEQREQSIIWRIIESIIMVAIICLLVYALAMIIYRLIKILLSIQRKKVIYEAETVEDVKDVHESISSKLPESGFDKEDESFLSPAQRIRRLYRKKALSSQKNKEELFRTTAREFALEENNPEMASIYEKARYSPHDCTKDDLKQMQLACRRKKSES